MLPFSFFDAHCDTLSCCAHRGWNLADAPGHVDLRRGAQFEHYAQIFAIFQDSALSPAGGMPAECRRQAEVFHQQLACSREQIMQVRSGTELKHAAETRRIAALLSIEGAELLDCSPAQLDWAREQGVVMINLTWNHANALSGSNLEQPQRGLSPQGRDFVRRAQALGILIDVSHLSDPGFWDLMDLTEQPVVASHSDARALCAHPRNLTDEMFRALREHGGFVGLNFYRLFLGRDGSLDAVFAHLEHFLELGGEKTLGFGGDWDGCDALPDGIRGIQDMDRIYDKMLQRNYSSELIEDLFYRNLKRVLFER